MIKLFFYDEYLELIDKGEFDVNRLDELLSNRIKNREIAFDNYEMQISKTSFILSRTKSDFVEIDVLDENTLSVHSDRFCFSDTLFGKLQRLFSFKPLFNIKVDLETAKMICLDYVNLDRQTFEYKYRYYTGKY